MDAGQNLADVMHSLNNLRVAPSISKSKRSSCSIISYGGQSFVEMLLTCRLINTGRIDHS
eukprot:2627748-Ditylum_brightwellii.AAC.1